MSERSVSEELAQLTEARARAETRLRELDTEQRAAGAALAAAQEAVSEFHRRGSGRKVEQQRLEQKLAEARAAVDQPWSERRAGLQRGLRDAQQEIQRFVGEHLPELVEERQLAGRASAERINAATAELLAGYSEWSRTANEISGLLALTRQVRPGDVSFTRCEALAREASRLLQEGGEREPVLRRRPGEPQRTELTGTPA
jgi:chromosome segregation ATPase